MWQNINAIIGVTEGEGLREEVGIEMLPSLCCFFNHFYGKFVGIVFKESVTRRIIKRFKKKNSIILLIMDSLALGCFHLPCKFIDNGGVKKICKDLCAWLSYLIPTAMMECITKQSSSNTRWTVAKETEWLGFYDYGDIKKKSLVFKCKRILYIQR